MLKKVQWFRFPTNTGSSGSKTENDYMQKRPPEPLVTSGRFFYGISYNILTMSTSRFE